MRWLAVLVVLLSPTMVLGQNYTFGDWARDQGYLPGDAMPDSVDARCFRGLCSPRIDSLDGIGDFDWATTPTTWLRLAGNQISSIESGDFDGLANLTELRLDGNQVSSIESGAFSGMPNLTELRLDGNQISSIESGAFSGLANLRTLYLGSNMALTELNLANAVFLNLGWFDLLSTENISSVSLRNTVVNGASLWAMIEGGTIDNHLIGIGDRDGITKMDLSGIDFADITRLWPLDMMDDLTDLWLVNTQNLDATDLDILLDNLETIEATDTEGVLHMTQADFDAFDAAGGGLLAAWNAEPGHHVEFLLPGDVNHDTEVNGLDVDPCVSVLLAGRFDVAADMNGDGAVNGLDVDPFVAAVVGGGAQSVPEPSTLLLCIIALGVVSGWRKWIS